VSTKNPGPTAIAMKELILLLHKAPRTKYELKELVGVCNTTVSRWMNMLHREGLVYVESWERTGARGSWTARWMWGYLHQDALKPKALSSSEYNRRYRINLVKRARTTTENGVTRHVAD